MLLDLDDGIGWHQENCPGIIVGDDADHGEQEKKLSAVPISYLTKGCPKQGGALCSCSCGKAVPDSRVVHPVIDLAIHAKR